MKRRPSFQPFLLLCLCFGLNLQPGSSVDPYPSPVAFDCNSVRPIPPLADDAVDATIKDSIDKVVAQLVTKVVPTGFETATYGSGASAVYGLLQCRADVSSKDCAACAIEAQTQLQNLCAKDGKARLWFDRCYLRYDTVNFFGKLDRMDNYITYNNGANASNPKVFQEKVKKLMSQVTAAAVAPGSGALGKGDIAVTPKVTIYGLAQCTRDLSPSICSNCLATAVSKFQTCCVGKERGNVIFGSCNVHYEVYRFF